MLTAIQQKCQDMPLEDVNSILTFNWQIVEQKGKTQQNKIWQI